jgi:hypothetical protein
MGGQVIPNISEEMMDAVEKIFFHGPSRAKNHDQRLGQYLLNKIHNEYGNHKTSRADEARILFNLENQEIWDLIKDYND